MPREWANIYTEELKWANKPGFYKWSKHSTGWDSKGSLWLGLGLQSWIFPLTSCSLSRHQRQDIEFSLCKHEWCWHGGKNGFSLGLQAH